MSGNCTNTTPVIDGIGWYFLSPSVTGETGTELVNRLNPNRIYSGNIIDICSNVYYYNHLNDPSSNGFPNNTTWNQSDWCVTTIDSILIPEIGYWIYILSYDLIGYQYVTVNWWSYWQTQTQSKVDQNAQVTAYLINDTANQHLFENNITPDTSKYISKESSPFKAAVGYHKVDPTTITFELLDISTNLNITGIILKANSTSNTGFSVGNGTGNGTTDYDPYPTAWTAPWFAVEIVSVTDTKGIVTNQTRQNYYDNLLFNGGTILNYNIDNSQTARTLNITSNLTHHILSMYYHADQIKISNNTTWPGGTFLSAQGDAYAGLLDASGGTGLINKIIDPGSGIWWWYTRIYEGSQLTGYLRIGRSKPSNDGTYGDYSVFSLS